MAHSCKGRARSMYLGTSIRTHASTKRITKRLLLVLGTRIRHARTAGSLWIRIVGVAWNRVLQLCWYCHIRQRHTLATRESTGYTTHQMNFMNHILTRFYCPKCGTSWEQRSSLKHICPNCQRKQNDATDNKLVQAPANRRR